MFQRLNEACSLSIDEYEEEVLEPRVLPQAIACISTIVLPPNSELGAFLTDFVALLEASRLQAMPVYLIL